MVTNIAKVLLIENGPDFNRMLRFCLDQAGFDVLEAATGGEGLRVLEQRSVDAVVLDLQLPNGRGPAVLEWLRQLDQMDEETLVWVVMSAMDYQDVVVTYGSLEGHPFFAKPFNPWDLVEFLEDKLS